MSSAYKRRLVLFCLLPAAALVAPHVALAAGAGGGNMPWDNPMRMFQQDLTGPFAYALSLLGVAGAGGALVMQREELSGFIRAVLWIILVASVLVGANAFLTTLGIAGAVVN